MTHVESVPREPLDVLLRRARGPAGDHPAPGDLARYRRGELPFAEADLLRGHFVECRDCREVLLLEPPAEEPEVADFGVVPAWRAMRRRIRRERWEIPMVVAASILLVALGLTTKINFDMRSMVAKLSQPRLNVAVFDLIPGDDRVRDFAAEGRGEVLELAPGVEAVTFVLHLDALEGVEADAYRVEIRDRSGRKVWSERGLEIEHGTATLGVSRRSLDSGDYDVLVYVDDSSQQPLLLESYPVKVRYLTGSKEAPR